MRIKAMEKEKTMVDTPENPRLTQLRRLLAARENLPGFEKNCKSIREQIALLEKSA